MSNAFAQSPLEADWFGQENPDEAHDAAARSAAAMRALAEDIKPPSQVVQRVLRLCNDPASSMVEIRKTIEADPVLASQLLRFANSASMTTRTRCRSLDDAVVRLGLKRVRGVTAGLAALGAFEGETPHMEKIRAHSAQVAAVVQLIGREWRQNYAGDLFLAGLVHDIGQLVFLETDTLEYPEGSVSEEDAVRLERERVGFDHAALGRVMLEAWRFPDDLVAIVDMHHDPARAYAVGGPVAVSTALLGLANRIDAAFEEDVEPAELAHSGECSYLGITATHLDAAWPKISEARADAQTLLDG